MKNDIVVIICYFGSLPEYFNLFIKTCEYNPKIDYLIFTDQSLEEYNIPENIFIKECKFSDLRELIQAKFDFKIVLDTPYKLCDYKPTYGYIFSKYISGYTYWGHCDIDMMFGNVAKFFPKDMAKYDKLYHAGHFTLYKNTDKNNMVFKNNYGLDYKKVFSSNENFIFDEFNGVDAKYRHLQIPKYYSRDYIDISTKYYKMIRAKDGDIKSDAMNDNYKYQLFVWEEGNIFRYYFKDGRILKDEFNYIHFQKRKMTRICDSKCNKFAIVSNGFVEINEEITLKLIKSLNGRNIFKDFAYGLNSYIIRAKVKIRKILNK